MDILFALLGFAGFEGTRILKRLGADEKPLPDQTGVYFVAVLVVAIFTGAVGYAMDLDSAIKSLFIGFSLPSSGKAILEPYNKAPSAAGGATDDDDVDDIEVSMVSRFGWSNLRKVYFGA